MKRMICLVSAFLLVYLGGVCYCHGLLLLSLATSMACAGCIVLAQWCEKSEE